MRTDSPRWHTNDRQKPSHSSRSSKSKADGHGGNDAATVFARLIDAPDPETFDRLRGAVLDAMTGIKVARRKMKPQLQPGERVQEWVDEEGETLYVYIAPPDVKLMTLVLEQNLGKPALRPHESVDPIINIMTCVAGYGLTPEQEGKGAAPAAGSLTPEEEEEQAVAGSLAGLVDGLMEEIGGTDVPADDDMEGVDMEDR